MIKLLLKIRGHFIATNQTVQSASFSVLNFCNLFQIWHKACFKCQECNMTLSMRNYKGFDKLPYCGAHVPKAKATVIADTPENR